MNRLQSAEKIEELIEGAIDLHVHVSPDVVPRALDAIEMALECRQAGMKGFLLKDHLTVTSDRAYFVEKACPGIRVFGAVVLNHAVGGLNPSAVLAALALKAKQVFMPTFSADHHIRQSKNAHNPLDLLTSSEKQQGIRILSGNGALVPELDDILEMIKKSNAILGTGHLSPEESLALVERAQYVGLTKIVVTHVSNPMIRMTIAQQKRAVGLGAFIEHSYLSCIKGVPINNIVREIREVGVERCILSTDLGQQGNPTPVEGFRRFINEVLQLGMDKNEIRCMIKRNPKILLDLE